MNNQRDHEMDSFSWRKRRIATTRHAHNRLGAVSTVLSNKRKISQAMFSRDTCTVSKSRHRHATVTLFSSKPLLLFLLSLFFLCSRTATATTNARMADPFLNSESVILITGAAGFIGSELAMALHRIYAPKTIVCVDSMDSVKGTLKTEEELALFEFKRQRAFHVMQTLKSKGVFYRADLAPSIPEYFDAGEVPILDYLVRDHPDITHVVHLAQDVQAHDQAIPRRKENTSAGMMEALLEQVLTLPTRPQVVYASSYEVYNHLHPTLTNAVPFSEDKPITTPSSLLGASKVIDELLARAYYETQGVYSVGLRFASVYGPWGVPGSPLFEMAERAVMGLDVVTVEEANVYKDVRDYVYIDDAVDAILAAMQYRTPNGVPVVINVGTGVGTSLEVVSEEIMDMFPSLESKEPPVFDSSVKGTVSYLNTERAKLLLGFQARVPLHDGLVRLLSWHYDRAFPYGGRPESHTANEDVTTKRNYIASQGIASCSPFDKECMRGAPVFPCASECSHQSKCTSSVYDDVVVFVRAITEKCPTVMYTVDLREELTAIPSANMAISTHSSSHLSDGCNVAFVSESSDLVQRLKKEQGFSLSITAVETFIKKPMVLKHGFWSLVPVATPNFVTGDEHILNLLPKLSPGVFFGEATTHAIYSDPNVVFRDIPSLLQEAKMQPYKEGTQSATAMLVARERPIEPGAKEDTPVSISVSESLQNAAYRMVRIGVIDDMSGDGYHPILDSSWVVHTLQQEDSRLFRCDVFGEVVQWDVGKDETAFEFIMSLHDMWSRVIMEDSGKEPWWLGDRVITVPQNYGNKESALQSRRLQQVGDTLDDDPEDADNNVEEIVEEDVEAGEIVGDEGDNKDDNVAEQEEVEDAGGDVEPVEEEGEADNQRIVEQNEVDDAKGDVEPVEEEAETDNERIVDQKEVEEAGGDVEAVENGDTVDEEADSVEEEQIIEAVQDGGANPEGVLEMNNEANEDDDMAEEDSDDDEKNKAFANDNEGLSPEDADQNAAGDQVAGEVEGEEAVKGFLNAGNDRVAVEEHGEVSGENADNEEEEEKKEDEDEMDTDEDEDEPNQDGQAQVVAKQPDIPDHDHSSYDTWMGILSSTSVQYFVRIVPSTEVGATYLDDYKY